MVGLEMRSCECVCVVISFHSFVAKQRWFGSSYGGRSVSLAERFLGVQGWDEKVLCVCLSTWSVVLGRWTGI